MAYSLDSNEFKTIQLNTNRKSFKRSSWSNLAMAVIKTGVVEKDILFFNSAWCDILLQIAGADGLKEDFIKLCKEK